MDQIYLNHKQLFLWRLSFLQDLDRLVVDVPDDLIVLSADREVGALREGRQLPGLGKRGIEGHDRLRGGRQPDLATVVVPIDFKVGHEQNLEKESAIYN